MVLVLLPLIGCRKDAPAGRYHLAHAETLCGAGDVAAAKDAVRALALIWPEGRETALNSPALAVLW